MIKKIGNPGVITNLVERPGATVGTLWTHGDTEKFFFNWSKDVYQ